MRTKRTVTRRIQVLKENRKKYARTSEIPVRDDAYREAVREHPEASVEEQYAYGFANTLAKKEILIPEDDLLAGYLFQYAYNVNFPMKVSEDFDPAERAKFQMDMEREIEETKELQSESASDELDEFADAVETWLVKHWDIRLPDMRCFLTLDGEHCSRGWKNRLEKRRVKKKSRRHMRSILY